jgi:hypothetical protein
VSGQFIRLGHDDRLFADELASPLRCLALSVGLLSVGTHSLPLLKSVLSLERGPGVLPWCEGTRWDRHHGLSGWSVLRLWCGRDGCRRCPHEVLPGDREVEASLSTKSRVELIDGVLNHGP